MTVRFWTLVCTTAVLGCSASPVDAPVPPNGSGPSPLAFGELIWLRGGVNGSGRPAIDSSRVYFSTSNLQLLALHRATGQVAWQSATGSSPSLPLGSFPLGALLVGSNVVAVEDDIVAFDRSSGSRRWRRATPGESFATSSIPGDALGDTLYVASTLGYVVALQGATGEELWRRAPNPTLNTTARGVSRVGGMLYVGWTAGPAGGVSALDIAARRVVWTREFKPERAGVSSARSYGQVAVVGNALFVTAADGTVYRLNRATGEVEWYRVSRLPPEGIEDDRYIDAAGSTLIVTSTSGWVEALDASDGRIVWTAHGERGSILRPPTIAGDAVFVIHAAGQIVALDVADGRIRWRGGEGGSDRVVPASTVAIVRDSALYFGGVGALAALRWR